MELWMERLGNRSIYKEIHQPFYVGQAFKMSLANKSSLVLDLLFPLP